MPLIAVDSNHSLLAPGITPNSQAADKSTHGQYHTLVQ